MFNELALMMVMMWPFIPIFLIQLARAKNFQKREIRGRTLSQTGDMPFARAFMVSRSKNLLTLLKKPVIYKTIAKDLRLKKVIRKQQCRYPQ